jgi:hypothetical protein
MNSIIKITVAIVAVAALSLTPWLLQRNTTRQLERENAALKERVTELDRNYTAAQDRTEGLKNELATARARNEELHRLRNEVNSLRRDQDERAKLKAQNEMLHSRLQAQLKREQEEQTQEQQASVQTQVDERIWVQGQINAVKDLGLEFIRFAQANDGLLPASFDQSAPYAQGDARANLALDNFQIVAQGQLAAIQDPANTILVRQIAPFQTADGKWVKVYVFADGHSEVASFNDPAQIRQWEDQRMLPPR